MRRVNQWKAFQVQAANTRKFAADLAGPKVLRCSKNESQPLGTENTTAVLTVVGFSLQDTIMVFDRIRENLGKPKNRRMHFEDIVNRKISPIYRAQLCRRVIHHLSA